MADSKRPARKRRRAHPQPKRTALTPKKAWQDVFLEALRASPNVSAAAEAAGYSRTQVYAVRKTDAEFARAWDDALEHSTDNAAGEAYRRAVYGTEEPVFGRLGGKQGDGQIGTIRKYSDTLLIFLLKSHRPETYRERIEVDHRRIDEEIERELAELAALRQAGDAGAAAGPEAPEAGAESDQPAGD